VIVMRDTPQQHKIFVIQVALIVAIMFMIVVFAVARY
jgi:hypothetical protein